MTKISVHKTNDLTKQTSKAPGHLNIVWKEPKILNTYTLQSEQPNPAKVQVNPAKVQVNPANVQINPAEVQVCKEPENLNSHTLQSEQQNSANIQVNPSKVQICKEPDILNTNAKSEKPIPAKVHRGVKFTSTNIEKLRHNVVEVLQCSDATPIKSGGISYVCGFCPLQYTNPQDLKQHNFDTHDDTDLCNLTIPTFAHSFQLKIDITNLKCKLCDLSINTLEDLFAHLIDKHKRNIHLDIGNRIIPFKFDDENLKCAICKIEYHNFKGLQEHMNTHYSNYVCSMCPAGFITPQKLAAHVRGHKQMKLEPAFKCALCPKAFPTAWRLKTHNTDVHFKRKITCTYCHEAFDSYKIRFKHLAEVHGVRVAEIKCNACDKTFDTPGLLSAHIKRNHLMERNHVCTLCDQKFHTKNDLADHTLTHTGVRNFECEYCHNRFSRKNTLREHIRIHIDDRRHHCDLCELKFFQKRTLKGHMLNKHGIQL
ncbi:hypothetical protein O0L34_g11986 [Tuta absoluta]|nr:hypothetical protein O0L34_g11986 [Tuta absoluta]